MILPESFLRCLSKEDRASLGKAGLTAEEAAARAEIKNHGHFQKLIYNLLRLKGIEPLTAPIGKKSRIKVGWPDITFAIGGFSMGDGMIYEAHAWELKLGRDELSDDQKRMHIRLSTPPNFWKVTVIRSVDEAVKILRGLGL